MEQFNLKDPLVRWNGIARVKADQRKTKISKRLYCLFQSIWISTQNLVQKKTSGTRANCLHTCIINNNEIYFQQKYMELFIYYMKFYFIIILNITKMFLLILQYIFLMSTMMSELTRAHSPWTTSIWQNSGKTVNYYSYGCSFMQLLLQQKTVVNGDEVCSEVSEPNMKF